jgi:hypothetical protein
MNCAKVIALIITLMIMTACAAGVSGKKYSFRGTDNASYTMTFEKSGRDGTVVLTKGNDTDLLDIGFYEKMEPRLYRIWFDNDCEFGSLFGTGSCMNYFFKDGEDMRFIDPAGPKLHQLEAEPK